MQQDEVTEIPLIYPLVSVTLKTCNIVDGKPIMSECEEVIDFTNAYGSMVRMSKLGKEFRGYVKKVLEATAQGRGALQNILDTHSRDPLPHPADRPSSQASEASPDQGTLPLDLPAGTPDKASL